MPKQSTSRLWSFHVSSSEFSAGSRCARSWRPVLQSAPTPAAALRVAAHFQRRGDTGQRFARNTTAHA
eukprot:6395941-Alexandrium_andersonii.AAC.1